MTTVIIVIHLMVVLAMIGLVLLQRSEGGALGIGGGQGAFLTGRSAGNVLTRSTAILALAFFATSLSLAFLAKFESKPSDILERLPAQTAPVTSKTPAPPEPTGAPANAQDLLKQLGGTSSGGPQTPPAPTGTNGGTNATPSAPAETPAAPGETTPGPQAPPAGQ